MALWSPWCTLIGVLAAAGTIFDKKDKLDAKDPVYDAGNGPSGAGGAMLWDRTLSELKLEYMDLDEFLTENGVAGGGKAMAALSPRHNPFRQPPLGEPQRLPPEPGPLQQPDEPGLAAPPNGEPACAQQRLPSCKCTSFA